MIRGLFLLLVLLAGLAAAALWQGRMHHLRLALPDRLPDWTAPVADDAGVRHGSLILPANGRLPETELVWTARLPTRAGWLWDVALTGDGVALAGQITLAFPGDEAVLSSVTGSVDLGTLSEIPVPVQGFARIDALTGAAVGLRGSPVITAALQAVVPDLRIDGHDFGSGPLTAMLEADGKWQARLALEGGVSKLDADMKGTLTTPVAQLEIGFDDGPALPATLRGILSAVARPEGQGWRLPLGLDVP